MWRYLYRAIDQRGQVIDVQVSAQRDAAAARRFFQRAITMLMVKPTEVVTDAAAVYPRGTRRTAARGVAPRGAVRKQSDRGRPQSAQTAITADARLRTDQTAQVVIAGQAFIQNLRRGHHEFGIEAPPAMRVAATFAELARAI